MLTLRVDGIAGDHIKDAAEEMCNLATRLDLVVRTKFNAIEILVKPGSRPAVVVKRYNAMIASDHPLKLFWVHPDE